MALPSYLVDASYEYKYNKLKSTNQHTDYDQFVTHMPSDFFRRGYVLDPENTTTLTPLPEQYAIMDAFAIRDSNGDFVYSDWIYSQCKKHGKTTLVAGILLWQSWRVPNGYVPIIANKIQQADSRLFRVIANTVSKHPVMKTYATRVRYKITLANGTIIEALPCNPEGEAGLNPTAIGYTEAWGIKTNKGIQMYSEMALSPTRAGQSFRITESYAGHSGESIPLENQYDNVVKPEYLINPDLELYANKRTGTIAYWGTKRLQAWQQGALADKYYAGEESRLSPNEFRRLHKNEWVSSEDVFVQPEWWNACKRASDAKPFIGANGVVIGIDAAVSNDCFAIVGVARQGDVVHELFTRVWTPAPGKEIDFLDVENAIVAYLKAYNVVCITYDPYQMKYMADRIKALGLVWVKEFTQGIPRLKADKALQDRIRNKQIVHTGFQTLTDHVLNANAKIDDDATKLRIVKRNDTKKVDACVALSMACAIATELNIGWNVRTKRNT